MAKEKSLAAQAASIGLALPERLAAPVAPIVSGLRWAPYITFAHNSRKDEWGKIQAKYGVVREGEMYYVDDKDVRHLTTAKVSYICGQQYWAHKDGAGVLQAFSKTPKPDPFREHVEAVVLLYLPEKVVPCNVTFHTTKCGGAKAMDETLRTASTPYWGEISAAHAATMSIPQAYLRFYAELSLNDPRTPKVRPGKPAGQPYRTLNARIAPTTNVEMAQIRAFIDSPDREELMRLADQRYADVLADLALKEVA